MTTKILTETRAILAPGYWISWAYEDESGEMQFGVDPVLYFEEQTFKYNDCIEPDVGILPATFKTSKSKNKIYSGFSDVLLQDECMNIFHESQATHHELEMIEEYKKTRRH